MYAFNNLFIESFLTISCFFMICLFFLLSIVSFFMFGTSFINQYEYGRREANSHVYTYKGGGFNEWMNRNSNWLYVLLNDSQNNIKRLEQWYICQKTAFIVNRIYKTDSFLYRIINKRYSLTYCLIDYYISVNMLLALNFI